MKKLPITVVICTYNEEGTIRDCLMSIIKNNPAEVIVVDGYSTDKTIRIAQRFKVKTIKSEVGLANQREAGVKVAGQPYLAFVDSDDRLEKDCLKILLEELRDNEFDAIQARMKIIDQGSYFQKAMAVNSDIVTKKPRITKMIGRPALYKTKVLKKIGFDGKYFGPGIGCEDTDMAIRMERNKYIQAIGTGVSYRIHANSLGKVLQKISKYGKGDARIVFKYPNKTINIIMHLLVTYPIVRCYKAVRQGNSIYTPFFILMGFGRFLYFCSEYIVLKIKYGNYENFK